MMQINVCTFLMANVIMFPILYSNDLKSSFFL